MTPQIAVVSRIGDSPPYTKRARWNHFWLVDPLSGPKDCSTAVGTLTVNIALIEDGKPICGVVYAPMSDTVYYAKAGHGSFKMVRDGPPQKLPLDCAAVSKTTAARELVALAAIGAASDKPEWECPTPGVVPALSICLLAEGEGGAYRSAEPTMEWEIAAAHTVADCAGRTVHARDSKELLRYNKKDLANEPFVAE